jgi:protein-L-isoaspartate(D-aspartate) O-methyltransferase
MFDFQAARTNMVDCQIHPSGISTSAILQAFGAIPREEFLPASVRGMAYADENIAIDKERFLLEPAIHARMIEALAPTKDDVVLDIGGSTGYSAAILSSLVQTVIAVEDKNRYIDDATQIWNRLGVCNVAAFKGPLPKGNPENAPFGLIFMNGAVSEIPETLVEQLSPRGRLITILRKPGEVLGRVTLVQSLGEKGFSSYTLFEAGCPYLPGFEPKPAFTF